MHSSPRYLNRDEVMWEEEDNPVSVGAIWDLISLFWTLYGLFNSLKQVTQKLFKKTM